MRRVGNLLSRANNQWFLICLISYVLFGLLTLQSADANSNIDAHVVKIRKYYKKILNQQKDLLYSNTIVINETNRVWPGSGNYHEKITFLYAHDELPEAENKPQTILKKVIRDYHVAAGQYYEEFLFQGGKLVFYFRRDGYHEQEERIYFVDNQPIKYSLVNVIQDEGGQADEKTFIQSHLPKMEMDLSLAVIKQSQLFIKMFFATFDNQFKSELESK